MRTNTHKIKCLESETSRALPAPGRRSVALGAVTLLWQPGEPFSLRSGASAAALARNYVPPSVTRRALNSPPNTTQSRFNHLGNFYLHHIEFVINLNQGDSEP